MKILAFGEVMLRLMVPNYKLLFQSDTLDYLFTGTGVNILSGLSQMKNDVYLCTSLPDNHVGKAAIAKIRELGINDQFISLKGNHISLYFLEKGFGARPDQVTYLNRSESSFNKATREDYDFETMLNNIDAIHLCGIALAINKETRQLTLDLAYLAKEKGVKVVFDCNYRPSLWEEKEKEVSRQVYREMLGLADIVFAGEKDATLICGIKSQYESSSSEYLEDVLSQFRHAFNIEVVVGTLRDNEHETLQGYLLCEDGFYKSKIHPLTVLERIGGGDAFAAGYLHAHYHMGDHLTQIEYATCSGVLGHTTYGDHVLLGEEDVLDYMHHGKRDIKR